LEVHYQPIVDLHTNRIHGFEALARWKHPTRGYIPPLKFIPVAEKSGQISALGDWVLRESCIQAKAWLDEGQAPRSVAVNISAAQILQVGFLESVRRTLKETALPPNLLCLELTESLFVGKSMSAVRKLLTELKALGISTALDDFGTGYSSLAYLEHLPFDKLKIDRSFVRGMQTGKKNVDLMKGIINLAHSLGMTVVAEGAESLGELSLLRELNADSVQGYVYAKPAPATEALTHADQIDRNGVYSKISAQS
jgi:EAL domain-containing protein (putative c-di-GMP-specific phosphodiesterase class I)